MENEYTDNLKNKFDAIILEECTESYLKFTTEINDIDRFIAFLLLADKFASIPKNFYEIRYFTSEVLEDSKNNRFKDLSDLVRSGKFDHWFSIYKYEKFLGQFLYARGVDNLIMYLKNILEEIVAKQSAILESSKIKNIAYGKTNDIKRGFEKIEVKLFLNEEDMMWFDEIVKKRNLIVHNRAIINKSFCEKFPNSKFRIGKELSFSYKDISEFYVKLTNFAAPLDSRLAQKFLLVLNNNHKIK